MAINRVEAGAMAEVARTCAQEGSALAAVIEYLTMISEELKKFANGENGIEMPAAMAENTLAYAKEIDRVIEEYKLAAKRMVTSVNNMMEQIQKLQAGAAAGAQASTEAAGKQTVKMGEVQGGVNL